jgi:tRNA pseudouridine55 synthase
MDGFINLLKPPGMTSSDAVVKVRKLLPRGTRIGHGGTLDPDAAGVLPLCVGRGTRLFDYLIDKRKTYVAEGCLGIETDTQDATGAVVARWEVRAGEGEIRAAMEKLTGDILQVPPMYSAVKRDGRRMYDLARKGEAVELEARPARVDAFEYLRATGPDRFLARIACGKGVYVRTLIHDLGRMLGCGAHMAFLLRTQAGAFDIENALTLDEVSKDVEAALMPLDAPLMHFPEVHVRPNAGRRLLNGNPISFCDLDRVPPQGEPVRVYLNGGLAAIAQAEGDGWLKVRVMLAGPPQAGED